MKRFVKMSVAAVVLLAVAGGIAYVAWSSAAPTIAFADVARQIESIHSMSFTIHIEMSPDPEGEPMQMTVKQFIKHPGKMRTESQMQSEDGPVSDMIMIFDMTQHRAISLSPERKKAFIIDLQNVPPEMIEQMERQDLLSELKKAIKSSPKDLGKRQIDGIETIGYAITQSGMTMDLWVDAETGLPVQMDVELPNGMGEATATDFVFNPEFDDSFFSTEVPPGYTTEQHQIDFSATEEDVIAGLEMLAELNDGEFPEGPVETFMYKAVNVKFDELEAVLSADVKEREAIISAEANELEAIFSEFDERKAKRSAEAKAWNSAFDEWDAKYGAEVKELDAKFAADIKELDANFSAEAMKELAAKHSADFEELVAKYSADIKALDANFSTEAKKALDANFVEAMKEREAKFTAEVEEEKGQLGDIIKEMQKLKGDEVVGEKIGKVMIFKATVQAGGGEWQYFGEGVKVGDADRAIAYWRLKDSPTCRVLYGDLHIEDADEPPAVPQTGENPDDSK